MKTVRIKSKKRITARAWAQHGGSWWVRYLDRDNIHRFLEIPDIPGWRRLDIVVDVPDHVTSVIAGIGNNPDFLQVVRINVVDLNEGSL